MEDFTKLKVGDKVCARKIECSWGRKTFEETLKDAVVTKVGRKYITVKIDDYAWETIFDKEYFIHDTYLCEKGEYRGNYQLFTNKQAALDYNKKDELFTKLRTYFEYRDWNIKRDFLDFDAV